MKFLRQGIALAVVGAGLAAVPAITATAPAVAKDDDTTQIQSMRDAADGSPTIRQEEATGKVGFIRAEPGGDLYPAAPAARSTASAPAAKADAYLDEYAAAFGAEPDQLKQTAVTPGDHGTTVDYVQEYQGVPVFGTLIRAHVDTDGDLTSVNGEAVPDLDLSVTPTIAKDKAAANAVRAVKAAPPGHDGEAADVTGIEAKTTELMVYRTGMVRGIDGENMLVWRVEVTNEKNVRDIVFIDATYGKPVNRYSMIHSALERVLYEADDQRQLTKVWEEGDDLPGTLNEDQESMVRSTGEAYWFFKNAFGRDSFDGEGAPMLTINNDPAIQCPNANWNGQTTNYCDGVSSDDVVAHEWGHAYTEYSHGLIYQWQAGALNEAYSDIWGETVDLINNRLDEGEGNLNAKRAVDTCSSNSPAVPLLSINSPSDIAKECLTGGASFGEQLDGTGITGDVVTPTDAVEDGGTALDGCSPYDEDVTGQIVLVDRGFCPFTQKAEVARDAGATAVIIGNSDDSAIGMSGDDPSLPPTVSIGMGDRELIRSAIADGETVNITMKDAGGAREDSFRWLIGEKSTAFGGAIRDMWNPTCYGDPGKVSDAEYKCSTDDNGGVHGNSGVPNHGYALLVDGGTYNGVTVEGIGLTKAAHIYYKAMDEYQTPISNFADHADSLEASCADLTGKRLNKLSTKEDDKQAYNEKITADDCAQVAAMAEAVELRLDPTEQCAFEPLLPDEAGSACGEGFETTTAFSEDFEAGLDAWPQSEELAEGAQRGFDWAASTEAPGGNATGVAFGTDPVEGDCVPGSDDISSANSLISPEIEVPAGVTPLVSFDHYVATEGGWDGGVVRLSVNGGDFETVPSSAYVVNAPNGQLEVAAAGNTNPLAGEEAFTGTDGGELVGTWGTSRIDLSQVGAGAGDTIQIEFVMTRDGCNGFDGWYVDNVEVTACAAPAVIAATHVPEPSRYGNEHSLDVQVSTEGDVVPSGTVTLSEGDRAYGTRTVDADGKANFKLPRGLAVGSHTLKIEYSGDDDFAPQESTTKITMSKASSRTTATATPLTISSTGSISLKITVDSASIGTPTGLVTLLRSQQPIGVYALSGGQRTLKIDASKLKVGKNYLQVSYGGSATFGMSKTGSIVVTVTR
ncbi:M4 family metallopeptidase [Nocardioides sp. AE5]|uniref:M4 family metallopeptidase n=1 Tax=Nocardioides sp. AE5 TaxID=2962573 RepID=UPI0028818251|nr:M4 family metallopeptidase [Nocardioides sp. AE5]MDT0203345.1 M4 family metallopeptidase [Nocardioides sp. AE5]